MQGTALMTELKVFGVIGICNNVISGKLSILKMREATRVINSRHVCLLAANLIF